MCDIEGERKKIDALIEQAISPFWFEDARNRRALVDYACKCVNEEYSLYCTEDCIRNLGAKLMSPSA